MATNTARAAFLSLRLLSCRRGRRTRTPRPLRRNERWAANERSSERSSAPRHKAAFVASPGSTTSLRHRRSAVIGIGPELSRRRSLPRGTRAHFSASSLTRPGRRTRNPFTHARTHARRARSVTDTQVKRAIDFATFREVFLFPVFRVFQLRYPWVSWFHLPRATRFPGEISTAVSPRTRNKRILFTKKPPREWGFG